MELARFIDAVRFGDLSQSFAHRAEGSGFAELGEALDEAIRRLRDERHRLIDANRFYEAVLDDAPTALLTVDGDGKVELANKAARRLLDPPPRRPDRGFPRIWRGLRQRRSRAARSAGRGWCR